MAQITLNIPDAQMPRVVDALARLGDYNPATDGPKGAFAKAQLIRWLCETTLAIERGELERQAAAAAGQPPALTDIT